MIRLLRSILYFLSPFDKYLYIFFALLHLEIIFVLTRRIFQFFTLKQH